MSVQRRMTALAVSAAAAAGVLLGTAGSAHAATSTIHGEAKLCYTGTCQTVTFDHELTPTHHAFRDSVIVDTGFRKVTMRVASELGDNARPVFRISQITIQDFNDKTLNQQNYNTNHSAAAAPNLASDKQTLNETATIKAAGTVFANFTS